MIRKVPAEKMGALVVPQTVLSTEFWLVLCQEKGKWEGLFLKTKATSRILLSVSMPICKTKQ